MFTKHKKKALRWCMPPHHALLPSCRVSKNFISYTKYKERKEKKKKKVLNLLSQQETIKWNHDVIQLHRNRHEDGRRLKGLARRRRPGSLAPSWWAWGSSAWQLLGSQTCVTCGSQTSLPGMRSGGIRTYFITKKKMLRELFVMAPNRKVRKCLSARWVSNCGVFAQFFMVQR